MKYQVTRHVKSKDFNKYLEEWKSQYESRLKDEMEILQDEISHLNRTAAPNGERRSNIDDDEPEYAGENFKVFGMDKNKNSERETQIDSGGSNAHSDIDSKGKTVRLENDPNARKSKDDTIYLSAVERGDMETAQRMVDEAANDFAGWGLTRDMQVRYNDTAVIRLPFTNERI